MVGGVEAVGGAPAVAQFDHVGGCAGAQLVHAVLAVEHQGAGDAEPVEDLGHRLHEVPARHSEGAQARARRVAQRSQEVEDGARAQFPARAGRVLEGRVEERGEQEGDAGAPQTGGGFVGTEVDADPEFLQDVRAAAGGRRAAVAVLGDADPAGRGDDRGHGGDVEGVQAVAAGSAGVEQLTLAPDGGGELVGRAGHSHEVVDGGAAHRDGQREPRDLGRCRLAAHDHAHRLGRLGLGQAPPGDRSQ